MNQRTHVSRSSLAALLAALIASLVGVCTALVGATVGLLGLSEFVAAAILSVSLVALCHVLGLRQPRVLTAIAVVAAVAWLVGHLGAEAWLLRWALIAQAEQGELLLAEEMVVRGAEGASDLVDLELVGRTGHGGFGGALILLYERGITVFSLRTDARVLPVPETVHAVYHAARGALVALLLRRALLHMAVEPTCARCGRALRRRRLGRVGEAERERLIAAWQVGERTTADEYDDRADLVLWEDRCPAGHSASPGLELSRRRRVGLSSAQPGPIARLEAECDDPHGEVSADRPLVDGEITG